MNYLCIDPGTTQSAYVIWDGVRVFDKGMILNKDLVAYVKEIQFIDHLVIEMVASYGMPVGKEVFETVLWIGRFIEAFPRQKSLVYRRDIKIHHCGSMKAKDSNIRQALVDKYGKPGTKKVPNPVYNDSVVKMSGDLWSAFAIATAVTENSKLNLFEI